MITDLEKGIAHFFPEGKKVGGGDGGVFSPVFVKNFDGEIWECFVHSWDFSGSAWPTGEPWDVKILRLEGTARDAYEFVARHVDVGKLRRRAEDALRKGGVEQLLRVIATLDVRLL